MSQLIFDAVANVLSLTFFLGMVVAVIGVALFFRKKRKNEHNRG